MNKKRKKDGLDYMMYAIMGILYLLADFFIVKACSYITAYKRKPISDALSIMMSEIGNNPLNFPGEPTNAFAIILIFTIACAMAIVMFQLQEKTNAHVKQGTEEGTAQWMTSVDPNLEKWNKKYSDPANSPTKSGRENAIMTQDIYLSMNTKQTRRNLNTLIVGGSGAGKSRFFVKPNLCEMPLNCNFICTDPSGELLAETGSMLEGAGYKVKVFNLVDMAESDRYNPLNYINCENDVILLVDCILANTTDPKKTGGDEFWEKAQKLMFQALIFLVWEFGDKFRLEKNLNTIVTLMDGCKISEEETSNSSQGGKTAEYFAALETKGWYFDTNGKFHSGHPSQENQKPSENENEPYYYYPPLENPEYDICIKQWTKFMAGAGKTLKSILISAMARLSTLDSPAIADLISEDNIELNKIGDEKTALFVIVPQEHESFNFLAAMLYTQLFQSMYFHAERECQGNYLVKDSNGEMVKVFEISHTSTIDYEDENAEEIEIDFIGTSSKYTEKESKNTDEEENVSLDDLNDISNQEEENRKNNCNKKDNSKEQKITQEDINICEEVSFNIAIDRKDTEINEDTGKTDADVEAQAQAFCERAKQAHCTKKGSKFLIKVPSANPDEDEEVVGVYGNADFASKRLMAIKNGCKVSRCGLHLPYHVRFILDEFANIGKIPDFTKKLATCRKYSISVSIILQSLQQIKNLYKDDWGTIVGNCDSFLFLGCQEIDTLEYVVKLLGKQTQRKRNESVSKGGKGGTNMSYQFSGRDLMTADELRRLDNDDCVYILRGELPYKGKKHQFVNHPNYKYTSDADKNNLYKFRPKPRKAKFTENTFSVPNTYKFDATTTSALPDNNISTSEKSHPKKSSFGGLANNDSSSCQLEAKTEEKIRIMRLNTSDTLDYNSVSALTNYGYLMTDILPIGVDKYAESEAVRGTGKGTGEESSSFGQNVVNVNN